jgi:AraC-like DNA-binding protein
MDFVFEERPSDSPFIATIWTTRTAQADAFMSLAVSHIELVVTLLAGRATLTVRGPETVATPAPIPAEAAFVGITLTLGSHLPVIPSGELVDVHRTLPDASRDGFWLHGGRWELPTFDNAETFVNRLVRQGLLEHEPLVNDALAGRRTDLSTRSMQRRFLRATGLTQGTLMQIERARFALALLEGGASILDTVDQAGYSDQPHLTRSLKRFVGRTPAEILRMVVPGIRSA